MKITTRATRNIQEKDKEHLMSDPYAPEMKTRTEEGSPTHEHPPCPYSLFSLCLLFTGVVFIFVFFENILISFEWSNSDNYINQNCRHLKPIIPNIDLSPLSPQREERFRAVQVCLLFTGAVFIFVFFENTLISFEWSNSDNYINQNCRH